MSDTAARLAHAGTVVLAGAGQMGGAMLAAWLDAGLPAHTVAVLDPRPSEALKTQLARAGVRLNPASVPTADVLVLAIKPQMLADAAPTIAPAVTPTTALVSVLAGKTIADLRHAFPDAGAIVRAMPNTPAAVRRGMTGVAAEPTLTAAQRDAVAALCGAVGAVEWLADETLIDAVTALSGSGPAYVFHLAECLAAAGAAAGLPPEVAARMARVTVEGAGALMAARPDTSPEALRRSVTSPGGTTAAALDVLTRTGGLEALMTEAVAAAKRRAGELAG